MTMCILLENILNVSLVFLSDEPISLLLDIVFVWYSL